MTVSHQMGSAKLTVQALQEYARRHPHTSAAGMVADGSPGEEAGAGRPERAKNEGTISKGLISIT